MSVKEERKIQRGYGSAARPLARELFARDTYKDNPILAEEGNYIPSPDKVNFDYKQFYNHDYAAQEHEKVLLKTWQLAAREEDIPAVGDRVPFNLGHSSFIISRAGPDEFKAFYNSCRHRGAMLCTKKTSGETIRCPVHGWEWKPNGKLSKIPGWWDFPDLTPLNGGLREVRLERWGGFIFINADEDAKPLLHELGPIPEHFKPWEPTERYTAMRLRKLIRCNWKIGQEPFQESYHVTETHGQFAASIIGDTQASNDIFKYGDDHIGVARNAANGGVPSMNAPAEHSMISAANIWLRGVAHFLYPEETPIEVDPTKDTRKQTADWHRAMLKKYHGFESEAPDAVLNDVLVYFLFPNTLLHLSEMLPYSWVFTPHESDPEMCYVDLRVLLPVPRGKPRPPAAEAVYLDADQRVTEHMPQLDFQANVVQEDVDNMELLQRGVRAADPRNAYSHLGLYQEMTLRHWHATYEEYMAR